MLLLEENPMLSLEKHIPILPVLKCALGCGIVVGCVAAAAIAGAAPAKESIPAFSSKDFGWNANFWDFQLDPPPGSGHGPIKTDPAYPYNSQIQNGGLFRGELQVPIVDTKDPVLKPWAAAEMQATNEELISGKRKLPFVAQSRCWPGGVPGQLLYLEPVYFLQKPNEVVMLWQRNSFVRRVYLTDKHSAEVKPSWFGESIGHYENGDTLVVDTIGLSAKNSYIDSFRTPHTDKLHVVERFTLAPDGKSITAMVAVDDPDTFNEPLILKQTWRKNEVEITESVCAADGGVDMFNLNLFPIPQAGKPDF
jgi:hypothetical protein